MDIVEIPLSSLRPHPLNSNVMAEELIVKLAAHVARTGRYPPVIVREMGKASGGASVAGRFQILDGHHRVEALTRNGARTARCVVWDVDDAEALTLLATLNRLQGQDDPKKRGRLIEEMRKLGGLDERGLVRQLPEACKQLRALLALNELPRARPPRDVGELPVAVHFFLSSQERARLEARLREVGGAREAALMRLVDAREPPG